MNQSRLALTFSLAFLLTLGGTIWTSSAKAFRVAEPGVAAAEKAKAFVDTLSAAERKEAVFAFETEKRLDWHFIPKDERKGLIVGEMSEQQKQSLLELMQSLLSDVGEKKVRGAMKIEGLVAALEGEGRRWPRDPELYYITLFGDPASFGADGVQWGLSFEGHHVSLNYTFDGTTVIDSTPQFLGAHPAKVMGENDLGFPVGYRLLGDEESIGFDLLASLDDNQRKTAVIQKEAPREVLTAGQPSPLEGAAAGLPASDMDDDQKRMLRDLVALYVDIVADPLAKARLNEAKEAGLENIHFAWAGGDAPGQPHYYRIEGPTFEIELANTQPDAEGNPANHLHAMYRDNRGDFGLDD